MTSKLPTVNANKTQTTTSGQKSPQLDKPATKPDTLPPLPPGYKMRRLDVILPPEHRELIGRKIMQLVNEGAMLKNGKLVTDRTKAVLWIIENCL